MKVLLIDRNKFQRIIDVPEDNFNQYYLPIQKLDSYLTTSEMMEVPIEQRFKKGIYVRKGMAKTQKGEIPVFIEEF